MKLVEMFQRRQRRGRCYVIPRLPVCMELSDGDRAALYGWPDRYVEEVSKNASRADSVNDR
jgi:hypothetical protein